MSHHTTALSITVPNQDSVSTYDEERSKLKQNIASLKRTISSADNDDVPEYNIYIIVLKQHRNHYLVEKVLVIFMLKI